MLVELSVHVSGRIAWIWILRSVHARDLEIPNKLHKETPEVHRRIQDYYRGRSQARLLACYR